MQLLFSIFVSIFVLSCSYLQGQIKIHKHLTSANGLINDRVYSIVQDPKGYLWIGTDGGISIWDGINFRNLLKQDGLSSLRIRDIAIGRDSSIYISTFGGGLNIFKGDSITIINESNGLQTNWLLSICVLQNGNVLVGGENGNISLINNGKISKWIDPQKLNNKDVYEIFQSSDGTIFIGTFQGGFYTYKANILKNYTAKEGLVNENVYDFFENDDGSFYLTTNLGIHLYKQNKIEFMNTKWGRRNSSCKKIVGDQRGNIYFATDEGVLIINKEKHKVDLISTANGLSFNELDPLFVDEYGTIYIGTFGNGIDIFNPEGIEIYNSSTGLPSNKVWSIFQDNSEFYLGTHNGLFYYTEAKSKQINMSEYGYGNVVKDIVKSVDGKLYLGTTYGINILAGSSNKKLTKTEGLIDTYILDMEKTPDGKILAATRFGVIVIEDGKISNLTKKDGLIDDYILSILVSRDSTIYFGTDGQGISLLKNGIFKNLTSINGLSDLTINALAEDKDGTIYIGTDEGGLNILRDGKITVLDITSGLSSNSVKAIAVSKSGELYISTQQGLNILKFKNGEPSFKLINSESGLPSNLCLDKALFIDKDNYVWIGTSNGLVRYNSQNSIENRIPPKIHINSLKIFGEDFALSDLNKSPELKYDQNYIIFNYTGINLSAPNKIIYKYRLDDLDKDWNESKNDFVQYTNLGSGSYTFEVKAMNESGYWSEPAKISFVITPPFWKTWWAYVIYFVLAAAGFFTIRRYELNRIRLRNDLKQKEFESKKLQEVDEIKSRFFANISHEFRTPLTIILGSIEKIRKELGDKLSDKDFNPLSRNAARLLQLINQLLELSRIESGTVKLSVAENDIVKFLKRVAITFSSLAFQKKLTLNFNGIPIESYQETDAVQIYYDKKKMETVFYNLLSNAIKFSPEGETINISINRENDHVIIVFTNTGIEIPKNDLDRIFDRFYQVDNTGTRNFEGTGIGLALVKEYVELHKGTIQVSSINNKVSFTISLKTGKSHFTNNDLMISSTEDDIKDVPLYAQIPHQIDEKVSELHESDKTIILIVEDNFDLRTMIKEILCDNYSVLEAENGVKGLELAEEHIPDLIISDIMMPQMDGYELSRRIKLNEKINHIPLILLTAKAATDDKLEGLETGADDYLIKPFNEEELKIRVRNLIKIRRQMREKYQAQMLVKPSEVVIPSVQKQFLDKLINIIEANISDENFSVEILCDKIGISRAQLHRKVKAITNQSTSEFIRNLRLQRAAELLKQDAGNIAEITYLVGFGSQAYFTKLFQEMFGQTPLEYKKQHLE